MEDPMVVNGEVEDQTAEDFYDADETKLTLLDSKIKWLESQKLDLSNDNNELKDRIEKVTLEFDRLRDQEAEMRKEMDQWDEDKRVLESVTARSASLETEVARLQHDLITSMSEVDEANKELSRLKGDLEEKGALIERLDRELTELKKEKVEGEQRERELERKLGVLEVGETEERGKRVRTEEEMRDKVNELQNKVMELEAELGRTRVELETTKEEKRESEEKATGLQMKLLEVQEEVEKKTSEGINGKSREIEGTSGSKGKGPTVTPFVAAGTVAAIVVAAAAVYLCSRTRS
ncbi:putative Phy rapidly regulated 1 [Hibiscus syriacus]|uniref:Phy rapidly regulated 1 n=1 Tax=Hibiscus syriacus TaxID=106335 RepID=A0A6A3AZT4_HIBSY|nr:peroxisomal and mitochondrial division factor 2-like [Hibiscus syriacus]KAE8709976.1 putative Phy rapidly regulated 1 [Hibiscus syriacus]